MNVVDEIMNDLQNGLRNIFESDQYISYLDVMSRFHNYSTNNWILIHMQKPEATLLAGYKQWQERFGRYVRRYEKGIKILAPYCVGNRLYGYKYVTVFDITQTNGDPLPNSGIRSKVLESDVNDYELIYKAIEKIAPLPIVFEKLDGLDGKCIYGEKIVINRGMSEAQNILSMLHEIAHALLHNNSCLSDESEEIEAESVAYAVCKYLGIDTSKNSFGYIASHSDNLKMWSKKQPMELLKTCLDRIAKTTKDIIGRLNIILEIEKDLPIIESGEFYELANKGVKYFEGIDVEQDYETAINYFCAAGERVIVDEYSGRGVTEDIENFQVGALGLDKYGKKVFQWCLQHAETGCYKSQFVLANLYVLGIGNEIDDEDDALDEAFKWYLKSAQQGYRPAKYKLGLCYKYGLGICDDEEKYLYWFKQAAESGDVRAQFALGVENQLHILNNFDEREAIRWFSMAAEQGDAGAQYELGVCYYQGIGTNIDYEESFKWYEKASQQGNQDARLNLVHFYLYGLVVEKNISKGMDLLLEAVKEDDAVAKRYLSNMIKYATENDKFNYPLHRILDGEDLFL